MLRWSLAEYTRRSSFHQPVCSPVLIAEAQIPRLALRHHDSGIVQVKFYIRIRINGNPKENRRV